MAKERIAIEIEPFAHDGKQYCLKLGIFDKFIGTCSHCRSYTGSLFYCMIDRNHVSITTERPEHCKRRKVSD